MKTVPLLDVMHTLPHSNVVTVNIKAITINKLSQGKKSCFLYNNPHFKGLTKTTYFVYALYKVSM